MESRRFPSPLDLVATAIRVVAYGPWLFFLGSLVILFFHLRETPFGAPVRPILIGWSLAAPIALDLWDAWRRRRRGWRRTRVLDRLDDTLAAGMAVANVVIVAFGFYLWSIG